jgi:type IV secretion system protein VirB10
MAVTSGPRDPDGDDPQAYGDDPYASPPRVARPPDRITMPLMLAAALGLGGLVFYGLNQNRVGVVEASLTDPAPGATPIIDSRTAPPPPPIAPPPMPEPAPAPPAAPQPVLVMPPDAGPDQATRLKAPSLVVDLSEPAAATAPSGPPQGAPTDPNAVMQALGGGAGAPRAPGASAPAGEMSSDERFAQRLGVDAGSDKPVQAKRLNNLQTLIPQGAMITAVLETAINSDLPGYARAVVTRDVKSFDGERVLVPRGSHVIGQYRSGVALGQSRAFVIWTRLIRPDGVHVDLGSPGTDALGRGGLEGRVDRHFLRRFGGAILLSLITAGANAATRDDTQVIINSTRAGGDAASVALQQEINVSPTINVAQGAPIRIFVARDLDFSTVETVR